MFNKIEVTFDLEEPSPAGAISLGDGTYRILVNKKIYDSLPKAAQDFISFHELGHIYLGHTDMDPKLKNRYEVELEADVFAAFMYKKLGLSEKELENFILFIEEMTDTNPPGKLRAELIRKIIFNKLKITQ